MCWPSELCSDGSTPEIGSNGRSNSIRHSGRVLVNDFQTEIDRLLQLSVAPSTARQYGVALRLFNELRREHMLETIWPVPLEDIMSFIAYMFRLELSHSTINCYISGLSFHHKISNLTDNTQLFVVRTLLEGDKRS
jgi:hypothetical protein